MVAFDTFSGVQPLRAVAYARFSSDNQREESITAQLRAIREYAEHKGITIVREYVDEARSATTDDRPGFLQMIEDLQTLHVDYVLVHKFDRFSRNRYDAVVYKRKIQKAGARLIAVAQPLDDTPEAGILEALLEAMAEYYSKNLGREIMKGMRETALQQKFCGGVPPLGYDIDPATKRYVINEREAAAVRLIFNMKLAGHGYGAIAAELNRRGYRTKRGRPFGKNSIHDILRNERYSGVYVFNQTPTRVAGKRSCHQRKSDEHIIRAENAIPAIIPRADWERVQELMQSRKIYSRKATREYILTGIMVCGHCGSAMVGASSGGGKDGQYRYHKYVCSAKSRGLECESRPLRADVIEDLVLDKLASTFAAGSLEQLADVVEAKYHERYARHDGERREIQRALAELSGRLDNLFNALETGSMPAEVAGPRITALANEKAALEDSLRRLDSETPKLNRHQIMEYLRQTSDIITTRAEPSELRRIVRQYVRRIIVTKDAVQIEYLFQLPDNTHSGGAGDADVMVCTLSDEFYVPKRRPRRSCKSA